MKSTWKKIGHFVSLLDLEREMTYLRKHEQWRKTAHEMGLKWAVSKINLYFKKADGETIEKQWNTDWAALHEDYQVAKFAFVEFGMIGWINVSENSHTYRAGQIKRIGDWTLKLWCVEDGEMTLLSQNEYVQDIINRFYIRKLHENVVPWRQQWGGQEMPQNLQTGQTYSGINLLTTLFTGGTYFLRKKQVLDLGGTFIYDPPKYPLVFWKWYTFVMVNSKVVTVTYLGNMWMDEWGKTYPKQKVRRGWFLRHFYIYDVEKATTGLEHLLPPPVENEYNPIEACEDIVRNMPNQPRIIYNHCVDKYDEVNDEVYIRPMEQFGLASDYFATLFNLLACSTFRSSRLNKPAERFNRDLIADLSASILCAEARVKPMTIERPTEFIESALKVLKSDRNQLIKSAQVASKVVDYILNRPSYEYNDNY